MPESLQDWTARLPKALHRLRPSVTDDLGDWVSQARASVAARAPRHTSALSRSITATFQGDADAGDIAIGSTDPAAMVLEEGKVHRGSPWIAVPLNHAIRSTGGPRSDGQLFGLTTRDGRVFLARSGSRTLDVRWRLMRRVTQRARPFIRPTLEALASDIPRRVLDTMDREIRR